MAKLNDKNQTLVSLVKGAQLKNAGVKSKDLYGSIGMPCESVKKGEDMIVYPSLYLNTKNAPDLSGYEVGDDVILIMRARITGHSLNESRLSHKRENYDIEIKEIGCAKKKE